MDTNLRQALRFIRNDPDRGGVVPQNNSELPSDQQLSIVWSYVKATGLHLMPGEVEYEALLNELDISSHADNS